MSSRYATSETATVAVPDGRGGTLQVRYLRRRRLPDLDAIGTLTGHTVGTQDRLDLISAQYLNDPTAFWQIADANAALDPEALVGPDAEGSTLRIPAPGI